MTFRKFTFQTFLNIALLFLSTNIALYGQQNCSCFVKGQVKDQHSGQPLVGATIILLENNRAVSTDTQGKYRLDKLCPGKYTLEGRIIGYAPFNHQIDLTEGHEENFSMEESEIHLQDIEIKAHRTDTPISQPTDVLAGTDLFQTRGQTLAESLKGLTGVNVLQTGSTIGKPVIHGLHSNRVLIMNNGVRQEGQQWGSEHAPEIDPFIATRMSVVKGAAGVRYGSDAIGGVILVDMEELPFNKPLSGELNLVGMSNGRQGVASAFLEGGLGKLKGFGWRAQGTLKRAGNTRTPNYFLDNTGTSEKNFSVSAGYRKKGFGIDVFYSLFDTEIGIFSGSHIGSITDLINVINNGEPFVKSGFSYAIGRPYQDVKHQLLKAETHYHFQDGNKIQWTIANQLNNRAEYDLHRSRNDSIAALNHPELSFKLNTLTNDIIWDHKPIRGILTGQAGVSTLYQYNLMSGRPLIPNFNQFTTGVFLIERLVKERWAIEGGLRYDYRHLISHQFLNKEKVSTEKNYSNFSGTLGGSFNISKTLSANLNFGTAWRAPNVSELYSAGVHHGAAAYEEGDPNLQPEKAYNSTASLKFAKEKLSIELGGYINYISGYIYLKPQPEPILTIRGAFPYFKYTQTNAIFKGIDATVSWEFIKNLHLNTKLSYLRVYDVKNDGYLVMIPPNRIDNQLKYEWNAIGKVIKPFVSVGNLWVAQQKRVPSNSDFLAPPPSYSLWNVQAGGSFRFSDKREMEISISSQNVLNTVDRDYMDRFRYYSDEMGRQVSLRVRYKFGV